MVQNTWITINGRKIKLLLLKTGILKDKIVNDIFIIFKTRLLVAKFRHS